MVEASEHRMRRVVAARDQARNDTDQCRYEKKALGSEYWRFVKEEQRDGWTLET